MNSAASLFSAEPTIQAIPMIKQRRKFRQFACNDIPAHKKLKSTQQHHKPLILRAPNYSVLLLNNTEQLIRLRLLAEL
jgi:hypothetical protein